MKIPQGFERKEDDVRITALVLATTVFFESPVSRVSAAILDAWNAYLAWCPPSSLNFYSTETMAEHKRASKKTLDMLPAWLAPGAPRRNILSFEIKDGSTFDEAPRWMFDLLAIDGDEDPSMLQIAVPYEVGAEDPQRMHAFTGALIHRLDVTHALAGYAMTVSQYEEEASHTFAWARSMRHRGVDILLSEADRVTVGKDGVKGAGWLTYINGPRVAALGGEAALRGALDPAVGVTPIGSGLLLQAGPRPEIGDQNRQETLPLYRSVFAAIEPLTTKAFDRALDLVLEDDDEATQLTLRWRRRLAE